MVIGAEMGVGVRSGVYPLQSEYVLRSDPHPSTNSPIHFFISLYHEHGLY